MYMFLKQEKPKMDDLKKKKKKLLVLMHTLAKMSQAILHILLFRNIFLIFIKNTCS